MGGVSAMMPRYSVAWWAGAFFVNAFLTGPRAYFGEYLVYSSLFDRVPLLENLTFLLKVGTVCGLLDAVDGRAAKLLAALLCVLFDCSPVRLLVLPRKEVLT